MTNLQVATWLALLDQRVGPLHTPTPEGRRPCSCNQANCAHIGKHPRTKNGKDDFTTDIEKIKEWWGMWPEANIGRRPQPHEIVIDVDPRNGGDVQLEAIQQRLGKLPPTRVIRTGGGGLHISLAYIGPVKGKLAPGIDLKTETGYVVAPPSLHESGGRYEVLDDSPVAPMPEQLVPYIQPPPTPIRRSGGFGDTPARRAGLLKWVTDATTGNRNDRLYWACRRAAEHGIDPNPLIDAAVTTGLSRNACEATCASAFRATQLELAL